MNLNNFTIKSQEVVQKAVEVAKINGNQAIEPIHLLKAVLLEGDMVVKFIFAKVGANLTRVSDTIDKEISSLPKVSAVCPSSGRYVNCFLRKATSIIQTTPIVHTVKRPGNI